MPASARSVGLDTNGLAAAMLRDMASVQQSTQSKWGYKRAAAAVLNLDRPLEELVEPDGSLRKIIHVGPASTRIIQEVLRTGTSAIVEQAIAAAAKTDEVGIRRRWRTNFLSHAQVLRALHDRHLTGPALEDYRGDLQMHSEWSDGSDTLEEIIEGCLARGYSYCAVTDHSYGLPIAGGVTMARLEEQHREIDALNTRYAGRFRMLKGIEANILADGRIDMTPEELATLDLVVASPHSVLRKADDQTARMIAAVTQPGVHILGHPRGRMYGSRPGVTADWPRVFEAAAKANVAIEIDGDPSRQDLDFELAARAIESGCLFAIDSDAHAVSQLRYAEIGLAHARLAGVPRDRVINTWPLDQLLEWTRSIAARAPSA
jgi:histidinol phosphatase-like PHP family hydrolase